jgi:Na+-transporting methylmalonyl-CoA/oxaloacetate decarboxylase gamma subunit
MEPYGRRAWMKRPTKNYATDKAYLFGNMGCFSILFCLVAASIVAFLDIQFTTKVLMIVLSAVVLSYLQHAYLVRIVNPFVERFFPDEERNEAYRKASEAADRASKRVARKASEAADKASRRGRWGE